MVKHITIDLDDKTHEALSKLKDEEGLTWAEILTDWKSLLDIREEIQDGGIVKTCEWAELGGTPWKLMMADQILFYERGYPAYKGLEAGRYMITLIMRKIAEEPEG